MSDEEDEWCDEPETIQGIPPQTSEHIVRLLTRQDFENSLVQLNSLLELAITIKQTVATPKGPVPIWHHFKDSHAHLLSKQLSNLIRSHANARISQEERKKLGAKLVRQCYEMIVRISQFYRIAIEKKLPYTQWAARCTVEELRDLNVIFKHLRKHDKEFRIHAVGKLPIRA